MADSGRAGGLALQIKDGRQKGARFFCLGELDLPQVRVFHKIAHLTLIYVPALMPHSLIPDNIASRSG